MKIMRKSLVGAMIVLACANGAMAAECNVVSNRDPLAGALKFIGGGVGLGTGVLLSPFAGLVAGPLGITAVSVGGAYLGVKVGAKIYAKNDYVCFDKDGKKCLQCDLHQIGDPYECNEGKVVVAPGIVKRCNTRLIGKDAWEDFKVPVCGDAVKLTGEKGSVVAELKSILLKDLASQGVPGAFVTEDDVCYTYKCAKDYEEKDGKCVKKGVTPPPPGQDGISEQECYDRGGIPMTNGTCRCRDGEWFSKDEGRCKSKSNCRNCIDGAGITFKLDNRGGIIVIGDNNSNISDGGNHNTNTNSNNNNYNGGGNSSSLQNCLNSRTTTNGKACCYLPKTGANGAQYDAATDKCNCNAAGKTFSVGTDGRGQCTGGNGPTTQCPANMYVGSDGTCKCNAKWQDPAEERNKVCKCGVPDAQNDANGNCACNDPNKVFNDETGQCVAKAKQCPAPGMEFDAASGNCKCVNPYQREINNFTGCECTVPGAKNDANNVCQCTDKDKVVKDGKCEYGESGLANIRANINAAFSSLSSKMGGFEKSVWKDAEGSFNTARLASDSIAGVVLGTAGGIITSKLVKKSQLKKGFEDIKCSIGGQNVASYGDTFSVGM